MKTQKYCDPFNHQPFFALVSQEHSELFLEVIARCSKCGEKLTDEEIILSLKNTHSEEAAEVIYTAYINKEAYYARFNQLSKLGVKSSLFLDLYSNRF